MPGQQHRTPDGSNRERIRETLVANIQQLDDRVQTAWTDDLDPEAERLQLTRLRTLSQLARQYRLLARDDDLDEMETQVAMLTELVDGGTDE